MPQGLRVLITNNTLGGVAGTEVFVRDLARHLVRRGHWPVVYSSLLGYVAEELRRSTVPVVDDLAALGERPDVIHGQHHLDAMTAMLRYPDVPAVLMCHGWLPWEEAPPVFPSIRRYVAVDDLCRERLLTTPGVSAERVTTIFNGVDLERFLPRPPLPPRPASALIFSNYATDETTVSVIRDACRRQGIMRVDVLGHGAGTAIPDPERLLPAYDVVFAKARCALEAMAVGAAVIVVDVPGVAGLVTPENVEALRRLNFGVRAMQASPLTVEAIERALSGYDAGAAADVSLWIRQHADVTSVWDTLLSLYGEARREGSPWSRDDAAFPALASGYLASLAPVLKGRYEVSRQLADLSRQHAGLVRQHTDLSQQHTDLARQADAQRDQEVAGLRNDVRALRDELATIHRSRAWRAVTVYRQLRARIGI